MLHRGNITITGLEDINRHPTVSVKLENGNVWLTKHELARLFGVFIQTIDANMRSIFKSRILNESEATITEKQDKLYVTYYNLEAVIFSASASIPIVRSCSASGCSTPCANTNG